jgi:hypothetical protein
LVYNVVKALQKEGILVYGYADDIPISMRGNFLNTLRDFMINALKIVHRWCETKGLSVNPLKTNIMVFTRKYKPEPIQPMRLKEKENCLHLFGEIFRSLTRPLIKLEATPHREKEEILLLYVGVWKSHEQDLGNWSYSSPMDVQGSSAAKNIVCISGLVAHGEKGGSNEPIAKPSWQLLMGCCQVYKNYTYRCAGSGPLFISPGPCHHCSS